MARLFHNWSPLAHPGHMPTWVIGWNPGHRSWLLGQLPMFWEDLQGHTDYVDPPWHRAIHHFLSDPSPLVLVRPTLPRSAFLGTEPLEIVVLYSPISFLKKWIYNGYQCWLQIKTKHCIFSVKDFDRLSINMCSTSWMRLFQIKVRDKKRVLTKQFTFSNLGFPK